MLLSVARPTVAPSLRTRRLSPFRGPATISSSMPRSSSISLQIQKDRGDIQDKTGEVVRGVGLVKLFEQTCDIKCTCVHVCGWRVKKLRRRTQ